MSYDCSIVLEINIMHFVAQLYELGTLNTHVPSFAHTRAADGFVFDKTEH